MQSVSYEIMSASTGLPEIDKIGDMIRSGTFKLSPVNLINSLLEMGFGEFQTLSRYLILFFSLGMVTTVLDLFGKNHNSGVSNASFFAVYGAVAATGIQCYTVCLQFAMGVIGEMTDFITKLSPVLSTLIITSGKNITAAAFHPVLSAAVYVITIICNKCILPLASYSVILTVADNLSDKVRVSGLCKLMNSTSKWVLTLSFTVFTGICAIYGFSAPSLDALSAKTVKFAVGSLIPVVGGFLSETLETVISGGKMMKNTVGTAGLIVLCSICILPVLKIGIMALIMRISAAVTEAVSDKRISGLLNGICSAITTLFGMVATVAVLFLINISILLAATG